MTEFCDRREVTNYHVKKRIVGLIEPLGMLAWSDGAVGVKTDDKVLKFLKHFVNQPVSSSQFGATTWMFSVANGGGVRRTYPLWN